MKKLVAMVSLYNSGDWIENRLNNLLQSSLGDDLEIWCVNANSPDPRDHDIPQKFSINYIQLPERVTVYAAWNNVIENSQSVYITNANSDDLVHPKCYELLINEIEQRKCDLAYPSWYCTKIPNQNWDNLKRVSSDAPGTYSGNVQSAGVGHFPLWRRSLHAKLGLFDDSFRALGDADWWARCYWVGKARFYWLNKKLGCYLWRDGQNLWHREISKEEWRRYHQKLSQYYKRGQNPHNPLQQPKMQRCQSE